LPIDAHDTSEPGPPERNTSSGGGESRFVSALMVLNELSMAEKKPSMTTPLSTPKESRMTTIAARTAAVRAGIHRPRSRPRAFAPLRSRRNMPTSPAPTTTAISRTTG
jgi:hypothetical protein